MRNRRIFQGMGCGVLFFLLLPAAAAEEEEYARAREEMVGIIEADVRSTSEYLDKERLDERVLTALRKVPRHEFVTPSLKRLAYENRPLPIGHGQTISQPYIVAVMTDLLKTAPGHRVLEVGTGSGYQAAILAELVKEVYTIEIIEPLGREAKERIQRLGYRNIKTRIGDGYYGWEEAAPFDAIVVTAAASHVPPPLLRQLKPGGRMIVPVGGGFMVQQLMLVIKGPDGKITTRQLMPVMFVPLTGSR